MRTLLCVLCVLCGFNSARALDRQAFTFTDYDLKIKVIPETQSFEAQGKVTLHNDTQEPQRKAVLQISSTLEWNAITVAGKRVQYLVATYTSDIDHSGALSEAVVTLPHSVQPQEAVEIEIAYSGKIARNITRLTNIGVPAARAAHSDWDQIDESFTGVRGVGFVAWYPVATESASLSEGNAVFQTGEAWKRKEAQASFSASICAGGYPTKPNVAVIANVAGGGGVGLTHIGASDQPLTMCNAFAWKPLGLTVPTFVVSDYQPLNQPPMAIQHVAGHESYARAWAAAGEKIAPFIAQWFGPRQRPVQIVELPDQNMYPFEGGSVFFTPLAGAEDKDIQLVLAHQLAHASFQSPRLWIDEGVAHFAQALEREQQEGRKAALDYMDARLPPLQEAEKEYLPAPGKTAKRTPRGQPLVSAKDEVFFRTKAMFVWWMLRDMVGDDALERALRAYRPDQDKEPSYFQRLLAAQFHRDLEWFFDDWVYRDRGLPQFRITIVYPRRLIPQDWSVTVSVENSGSAGAEVPVAVRAAQGEERKRLEIRAHEKGAVRIPIPATPQQAVVNDGSVPEYDMGNNTAEIKTDGQQ